MNYDTTNNSNIEHMRIIDARISSYVKEILQSQKRNGNSQQC